MSVLQYSDSTLVYFTVRYCTLLYFAVLVFQSRAKIKTHLFFPISLVDTYSNHQNPFQGSLPDFSSQVYFTDKTGQVTGSMAVMASHSLLVIIQVMCAASMEACVMSRGRHSQNQSTLCLREDRK